MSGLRFRGAVAEDLPRLLALYGDLAGPGEARLDSAAAGTLFARIRGLPGYTIYLAERDGAVVGTFTLVLLPNLAHGGAAIGIVENVVVERQARGGGIGRQLMDFARARCREAGCCKLMLSSGVRREAAHRFYASLGYDRHGYAFTVAP
ncbi:MAG: GNAT family N-acetyltransferase [Gammaproteobacteria bacterium]|nr:GNAT family N-acetyltransferase [Gammaproteobacteria bacterium]